MKLDYGEISELASGGAYGGLRSLSPTTEALLSCLLSAWPVYWYNWYDSVDNWDAIENAVSRAMYDICDEYICPGGPGIDEMIIALVVDEKPQHSTGGTFTEGAWRTRDLNTIKHDSEDLIDVVDNVVTVKNAGTYLVIGSAPCYRGTYHQLRLRNIDIGSTAITGQNSHAHQANTVQTHAFLTGVITIAASTDYELQHICYSTQATNGFGLPCYSGPEIFASLLIIKMDE
jgi:hypothetical protein